MTNLNWKRTGLGNAVDGGKRTIVTVEAMREMAMAEGASKRLVESRITRNASFASPVATYEPVQAAENRHIRILGYDGSWASR